MKPVHLTFHPSCLWIFPTPDATTTRASPFTLNPGQEDICAGSPSSAFHLLFPQVLSHVEFTLLAFAWTELRRGVCVCV